MKTLFITVAMVVLASTQLLSNRQDVQKKLKVESDTISNDSIEYELIVFEIGYETFLITQPFIEYYTKDYYKNWNNWYVMEWNNRFRHGPRYEIYVNEIFYDSQTDYGLEFEYRLYYFFRFFEKKYNVKLVQRGKTFN